MLGFQEIIIMLCVLWRVLYKQNKQLKEYC